jgi:hypothetical protein
MQLQILEVILWPRNQSFSPRRVRFEPGMVNVISGASKTGKSAVIPIIDYCLGAERCSVPVRTIRDACSWFGILVKTDEGAKLFARREPGDQQSTGDMFVLEGDNIDIPAAAPTKNTTVEAVKRMLDRLSGLTNLSFDPEDAANGFKARPSFRDLLAFCFQPQNIVANPDVLFFRADTNEHREKLRTIFPYVLGATTASLLAKQWELDRVLRELKRKERELAAQVQASESWKANLLNWVTEARELGLVSSADYEEVDQQRLDEQELLSILRGLAEKDSGDAGSPASGLEGSATEYVAVQRQESEIALRLSGIRRRLDQISAVKGGVDDYASGLKSQRQRMSISRWLRDLSKLENGHSCPICRGPMDEAHSELDRLCDSLANVESSIRQLDVTPAALDRELVFVKDELRESAEALKAVRTRRRGFEERSRAVADARATSAKMERFLGRVEQALRMFEGRTAESGLQQEVGLLREKASSLRKQISEAAHQRRLDAALAKISNLMGQITNGLDAEEPDDPARLDLRELTVRVGNENGRTDFLWEMGSGANWLSYHVSATLALQRFFLDQPDSAVPHLLLYDQPSQVYFPRRLARKNEETVDDEVKRLPDEDIESIRRFFTAFGNVVIRAVSKLQIIVLDHADSEVWGNIEGVTLIEEWRQDKKLVPMEWLS